MHVRVPSVVAAVLASAASLPALVAQSTTAPPPSYRETMPGTVVTFEIVQVPAGSVTIDGKAVEVRSFAIGRTEVTWDMYDVFALQLDGARGGARPPGADAIARPSQPYSAPDYGWGHAGYPAISITRQAAEAFAAWLAAATGKPYRLPTEAEWAHAAQLAAGQAFDGARRNELAWHRGNADAKTHPVAAKKPDAIGLFDLFGNAAEWVAAGNEQFVTRGGSFRDPADAIGPATRAEQDDAWTERDPQLPKSRWWLSDGPFVGFRLALSGDLPGPRKVP